MKKQNPKKVSAYYQKKEKLKQELQKGVDSGIIEEFNPEAFLKKLKLSRHSTKKN